MIEIEPITPYIGARIHGIDLANCTAEDLEAIYQALIEHQVIFF